jgi:hypothetical protein
MRTYLALALCLALAACFSSDEPVFSEERGQCPFSAPTSYDEIDDTPYRFVFETDGAYCKVTGPDDNVTRTLFVPLGRERWIVQGEDEQRPTYAIMRRRGDRLIQYIPQCRDFSADRLRRLGVIFDEERSRCTVKDAHQVETLFRSWSGGRATAAYRLVRDQPGG